uniref:OTU domain-containing protein n=1 Tax=Oryza punctata TaxID=4537 RepID=A0A0E0K0G8_ORYPU
MGAAQAKDAAHGHGRDQRRREPQGSRSRAAAAAQGGAVVPPPPPSSADRRTQQPGDGGRGRGTRGSSSAAAAVDRKGKKQISASDDRKQLSDRKGQQLNCPSQLIVPESIPHVFHKKIPMEDAVYHNFTNIDDALQRPEVCLRLNFLDRDYSEFRPVVPDGECFYRSFIFSYLEQAVDRIDTCHEDRLLAAVRELAGRAEHFQWASEYSRRCEAFERLIEKIKGWKRMRDYPTSRVSYNSGEFLLEFFSNYDTTDDIFAFLRLAAATWMCTYRRKFERRVIPLGEGRGLEDWCSTLVIPPQVPAYWIIIRALAEALRVAVQVENVNNGSSENTHYNAIHGTPHVTLLHIDDKYDILYPFPQGEDDSAAETSSGRAGQGWRGSESEQLVVRLLFCSQEEPLAGQHGLSPFQSPAQGGSAASRPPRPPCPPLPPLREPGDGGRGRGTTDAGSSPGVAAGDRKGKKKVDECSSSDAPRSPALSDEVEDAIVEIQRVMAQGKKDEEKSHPVKEKLLGSSTRAANQGHAKKKLSDGKGRQPNYSNRSHVDHKKIPMEEALNHYFGTINNAIQQREVALYLTDLDTRYSEFRPVHRDGECFYRSFMFSYLEQVVERVDTREEDRLLDAVRKLATRAERLQWTSEFSQRHKAFETLIEKIKGWKSMWERPTSTISYDRRDLLLELFSNYDTTEDIFAFLRLAAAIWICTHKTMYERHVTGLGEGHSLEDWCSTQVIPPGVHADDVVMTALSRALGVAIRVENTLDGTTKDLLSAALQLARPASSTNFRSIEDIYHIARETPRVILVHTYSHFDILYPFPPAASSAAFNQLRPPRQGRQGIVGGIQLHHDPAAVTSSRGDGQGEGDPAGSSSRRAARASCFHFCIRGGSKKRLD